MKIRILLLAGAAMCVSSAAFADNLTGAGFFGYENGRGDVNHYRFGGEANYMFDTSGLNLGASVSDQHIDVSGLDLDLVSLSGNIFWRGTQGAIGGTFSYHPLSGSFTIGPFGGSGSAELGSYGAFAEFYAADDITLRIKGGGFSGDGDGGYFGGGGSYYLLPNLSVGVNYNLVSINGTGSDVWSIEVGPEWLPFTGTPLTVGAFYTYAEFAGASSNAVGFSLKYRFGSAGSGSLVDWDRNGPTPTNGALDLKF